MSSTGKRIEKAFTKTSKKSKITIPKKYISFTIVAFCIFILGGGIVNILDNPPSIIPLQNGYTSLHPYMNEQTSTEGYVVMLINAAMFIGFYMAHRSTQVAYNRTSANRWLMAGIALIILGFGGNYLIIQLKQSLL
ncbi:MAG: hypothetical protein V1710_05110 [Candidatus Bathyarchaeota archaeon]